MSRVTVYRWSKYDISIDETRVSRRWGTREAIARHNGTVIETDCAEVDASQIGTDVEGMTARGFNPNWTVSEQRQVTA